jgi:hypothetical protein
MADTIARCLCHSSLIKIKEDHFECRRACKCPYSKGAGPRRCPHCGSNGPWKHLEIKIDGVSKFFWVCDVCPNDLPEITRGEMREAAVP